MESLAWTLLSQEPVQLGWRKILRRKYRYPDGREDIFEVKDEPHVATILCLTTEGRVVMARQFRPGPGDVLLEMPGGCLDTGETAEDGAARELLEETGYAGETEALTTSYNDAYSTMVRHICVVKNARRVSTPALDGSEFIEAVEISLDEFREHLRGGRLTDVEAGYLALDYLGLL